MARVRHASRNLPAQAAREYVQKRWKSSRIGWLRTLFKLYCNNSLSFTACRSVRFSALQQDPTTAAEHRLVTILLKLFHLGRSDVIESFIDSLHDVKPIEDMDSLARLLADDFQIALPHVAADEFQSCGSLLAKEAKESQQCLCLPIRADPQEPFLILVDLIHHRLVFVSSMPLHLVDADRRDSVQVAVGQAPPDCLFYRTKHAIPADSEGLGDLLPGHPPSPAQPSARRTRG